MQLTEDEFEEQYHPQQKPDDGGLLDFDEVKHLPAERVWTVVETGDPVNDSWYALPGFHIVNKVGYLTSETPWPDEDIEAVWFASWPELQAYDPERRRYVLYFPGMGEYIHLKVKRNGTVKVTTDGEDFAEDLRDTLGEDDFAYLTGDYVRLVAEAYAAALTDKEAETKAAFVAACNIPVIPKKED